VPASTEPDSTEEATSAADATRRLATGWLPCSHERWLADRRGDAIVVGPDGTWSLLALDGNGALAPITGLGTHGTWSVYGAGSSERLDLHDTTPRAINVLGLTDDGASPGTLATFQIAFDGTSGRMRWSTSQSSPPEETWFAPLCGPDAGVVPSCS
jgi:hypothetical protein